MTQLDAIEEAIDQFKHLCDGAEEEYILHAELVIKKLKQLKSRLIRERTR